MGFMDTLAKAKQYDQLLKRQNELNAAEATAMAKWSEGLAAQEAANREEMMKREYTKLGAEEILKQLGVIQPKPQMLQQGLAAQQYNGGYNG